MFPALHIFCDYIFRCLVVLKTRGLCVCAVEWNKVELIYIIDPLWD